MKLKGEKLKKLYDFITSELPPGAEILDHEVIKNLEYPLGSAPREVLYVEVVYNGKNENLKFNLREVFREIKKVEHECKRVFEGG